MIGGPLVSKDTDAAREEERCMNQLQSRTLGIQRPQTKLRADVELIMIMTHIKIQTTVQGMQKSVS